MKSKKDLEEAIKDKVAPLLEETMEKSWGLTIPKLEADISDRLTNPQLNIYVPLGLTFSQAKKAFRKEFLKRELRLHQGNISHLAKTLEVDRRSIHRAIKGLEIKSKEFKIRWDEKDEKEKHQEEIIDQTIRAGLEQYRELIQPQKMEQLYREVPTLSRNIVKFLPYPDWTWQDAEREFEKQFFLQALEEHHWKISETAAKLGIRAETLHRKVRRLGLRPSKTI